MVNQIFKFLDKGLNEPPSPPLYRAVKLLTISMEDEVLEEEWAVQRHFIGKAYMPEKTFNNPLEASSYLDFLNKTHGNDE